MLGGQRAASVMAPPPAMFPEHSSNVDADSCSEVRARLSLMRASACKHGGEDPAQRKGPGSAARRGRSRRPLPLGAALVPGRRNEAPLRRSGMALQAFQPRKGDGILHLLLRGLRVVDAHPGAQPQESVNRESASVLGGAGGGEHVVRTGTVVAQHLCSHPPDEEAAKRLAFVADVLCVTCLHLQVLGCHAVRRRDGALQIGREHCKTFAHGRDGHVTRGQLRELPLEAGVHAADDLLLRRDQDRPRLHVVLRLRQQVGRHDLGVCAAVGNDQNLARTCQHVNAANAVDNGLCSGDPLVARADDDVAGRHSDPVRHRCDGVRSPNRQQAVRTCHERSCLRDLRGAWGCHHHRGHACSDGRAGRHQHGAWQRIAPAGRVAARAADRLHGLARSATGDRHLCCAYAGALGLCEGPNARCRALQDAALLGRQGLEGCAEFLLAQEKLPGALGQLQEAPRVLQERLLPSHFHARDDLQRLFAGLGLYGLEALLFDLLRPDGPEARDLRLLSDGHRRPSRPECRGSLEP
mmetsp:Transcript_25027/g.79565  ORF Transcript_25027/g.79565 Transcript_25027/m.79565 type:complete len:524 (+) Transcript_25027:307-1878(+)